MISSEILSWLKLVREAKLPEAEIIRRLKMSGWNDDQINDVLSCNTSITNRKKEYLSYTITPDEFRTREKFRYKKTIFIVIPILIGLLLEGYFESGWWGIGIIAIIALITYLIIIFQQRKFRRDQHIELNEQGIIINQGGVIKKYVWEEFAGVMTEEEYIKYMPVSDQPGLSQEVARLNKEAHGNVFMLTWKKQPRLSHGTKALKIYAEPDNHEKVKEFLYRYLPHDVPSLKKRYKVAYIIYIITLILLVGLIFFHIIYRFLAY